MCGILHYILDDEHSAEIAHTLYRAQFRTMEQVRELFRGLELVEPGLVTVPDWRPEPPAVRDHAVPKTPSSA